MLYPLIWHTLLNLINADLCHAEVCHICSHWCLIVVQYTLKIKRIKSCLSSKTSPHKTILHNHRLKFPLFQCLFVTPCFSLLVCHYLFVTACLSLLVCHCLFVTACLSLLVCHCLFVNACLSMLVCHCLFVTACLSLLACHYSEQI